MNDENPKNRNMINKVGKSEDEEEDSHLRVHNQNLLTQIKKLKHDNKTLQEKLYCKTSLVDKETLTDPINLTTQKEANPTDVKKFSNVEVQTSHRYEENSIPKLINKKLQVYEVRIELQGCLIDILNTKVDTLANHCINRNK
jgi:hypothetical protein